MLAAAGDAYATATDLADFLVRSEGMPFRKAHHVTARIVALAAAQRKRLEELPLEVLRSVHPQMKESVFEVLSPARSVASRTSLGGTAPDNVRKAVSAARKRFL
jgi:argininosuccinate lyase